MKRAGKYLSLAAVLLLLLGGGVFLWHSGFFAAASSQESMQAYIQRFAPYSHLCFFLVQFLSVVLAPIPSNITALVGGVMFGTWLSFFLTFAAVLLGSLLVFVLARNLGQSFVNRVVGERVSAKYLDVIHAKTDVFLVLAFLFPFFPDDLLCILAGTHLHLPAALLFYRPAYPALGPALCQRPGRRILLHPGVGYGSHRCGRCRPVPVGHEVRRPGGGLDSAGTAAG